MAFIAVTSYPPLPPLTDSALTSFIFKLTALGGKAYGLFLRVRRARIRMAIEGPDEDQERSHQCQRSQSSRQGKLGFGCSHRSPLFLRRYAASDVYHVYVTIFENDGTTVSWPRRPTLVARRPITTLRRQFSRSIDVFFGFEKKLGRVKLA